MLSIKTQHISPSGGFTLLEVMIALAIFSVGMLGLSKMQVVALNNNSMALWRTIAMQQSDNMADILRSNTNFDGVVDSNFDPVTTTNPTPSKACIAIDNSTDCDAAELAAFDIYHWQTRLADELPSGKGKITKTNNVYEIVVMWDEKRTGVTGEGCSGVSTTDLKCYTLNIQV